MNIPKVTVGIPVFNGERFIKQAVDSVLKQTYPNFELIVTEDGSTDGTKAILDSICDPRLIVISDGTNKGIAFRLNQQIDEARGEIFIRMDADDLMFPWRLEKEVQFLENNPHIDVVGAGAIVVGNENELLGKRGLSPKSINNKNDFFVQSRFIHPTVAGRIEWFRKWKYRTEMSGNEDLDLWIRSHNESTFGDLYEPLLFYRDPYQFRLKTYIKRQKKYIRCLWSLRQYMDGTWFMLKCVARSFVATSGALLLTLLGKEERMISHRNQTLDSSEKELYSSILKTIS